MSLREDWRGMDVTGDAKMRRTVLIVGGAGYVGVPLSSYLLAKGYRVRCLDALIYGQHAAVAGLLGDPHYEFMRGDLRDKHVCEAALRDVSDVVILAGLVGDPVTRQHPVAHQAINVTGLGRFVDALDGRRLGKVVFASTCSNYGVVDGIADETTPLKPLSPYAVAKVNRELQLLQAVGHVDYTPVILRFATAFGLSARMRFDLTVSEFVRTLWAGETLQVYDADTWRPYVHVRDMARAIELMLRVSDGPVAGQVFNIGSDDANYTKAMLVEEISKQLASKRSVAFVEGTGDRRDYRVSFKKVRDRLGFVTTRTVADGIAELIGALNQGFYQSAVPYSMTNSAGIQLDTVAWANTALMDAEGGLD